MLMVQLDDVENDDEKRFAIGKMYRLDSNLFILFSRCEYAFLINTDAMESVIFEFKCNFLTCKEMTNTLILKRITI